MRISIIAAIGRNREIGREGKQLWDLPDELKLFKQLTTDHTVIMGKGTYESIGHPLPRRANIILSSTLEDRPGISIAPTLNEALARVPPSETETFVIGGRRVYEEALLVADRIYLTTVDGVFPQADTFFPEYDKRDWEFMESSIHRTDERHPYSFVTRVYDRKKTKESE